MRHTALAALAVILSIAALLTVQPRSDAASLFGAALPGFDVLDTAEGRGMTIAILAEDPASRPGSRASWRRFWPIIR